MCFTVPDAKVAILAERGDTKYEATKITTTSNTPCKDMVLRVRGDNGHLKVNTVTQNERGSTIIIIIIKKHSTITLYFHAVV